MCEDHVANRAMQPTAGFARKSSVYSGFRGGRSGGDSANTAPVASSTPIGGSGDGVYFEAEVVPDDEGAEYAVMMEAFERSTADAGASGAGAGASASARAGIRRKGSVYSSSNDDDDVDC